MFAYLLVILCVDSVHGSDPGMMNPVYDAHPNGQLSPPMADHRPHDEQGNIFWCYGKPTAILFFKMKAIHFSQIFLFC